jgi:predicted nucleic acid-binding protein
VPLYLTDSSIWIGARTNPGTYLADLLAERIAGDEVATCVPVALEVLTGPASGAELDRDWEAVWRHLRWLPVTEAVTERALELLRLLAHTTDGAHRRRPIDYVIAACAEAAPGATLWHWDGDLTAICDPAGIAHAPEHDRARLHGLPARRAP